MDKKKGPTPPSPQHPSRRAMFFYPTRDTDPHSKAELLKIAIDQGRKAELQKMKKI